MSTRIVIVVLSLALAAALVVIAYLLGQRSVERIAVTPAAEPRRVALPSEPPLIEPQPPQPDPAPEAEPEVGVYRTPQGQVTIATQPNRTAIAEYLQRVKRLQVGPAGVDMNDFAQQLMNDALNGRTSGIDELLRQAKEAERSAQKIAPPSGADAHYRLLLQLLAESTRVLELEKEALASKSPDALESLSARARGLQQKAKQLEQLEQQLK